MCDYCGCRSVAAIDQLSEEHEQVLALVYFLRGHAQRGELQPARTVADDLAVLLEVHTEKEEHGLFSELRTSWGADQRLDELTSEHQEIHDLVLAVMQGQSGWETAALRLTKALSEHILAEETDLFPYAMYELGSAAWSRIDAIHQQMGCAGTRLVGLGDRSAPG